MLKNYFYVACRNLLKNTVFSFSNIFGLAVGMAAFLLIIHYVRFERSYEDFNSNADHVYRVTLDLYNGSEYVVTDCETYAALGPLAKEKMSEVRDFVRMFHNDGYQEIRIGKEKYLEDGMYFADPSAFHIFSLEVVQGDKDAALTAPFKAVVTTSIAEKYFGRTDVVGESIDIDNRPYHITAVIRDLPPSTHLKFNVLMSHATLNSIHANWYKEDSWNGNNEYTYLLMAPGTDLAAFNKKLTELSVSLNEKIKDERFVAEPIKDIHLYSNKTFEPEVNGSAKVVYSMLVIALFIIIIAWVNYINLSTARAIERAREVGIRKVMGSVRTQLVFQFLSESVIVNLLAALLAFLLFQISLPLFRELSGQPLPLAFAREPWFWLSFTGLLAGGSLLSGIYPAFVLSSFQPAAVLKGKFRSSSHGQRLRKGLVIFQFGATVVLLVCLCTVYLQLRYLRQHDLGMNIDQTLVLRAPRIGATDSVYRSMFQSFKTELLKYPAVQQVARSESVPGLSLHELNTMDNIKPVGNEKQGGSYNYYCFAIDADFISTLGMELAGGRNFVDGMPNHDQVIINEEAVRTLGFSGIDEAIGAKITYWTRWKGEPATVIGVVKNFYQRSPKEQHIPMVFKYTEYAEYLSINLKATNVDETLASIQGAWNKVFGDQIFHYFFLDDTYDQQYQADKQFGEVIATFSGLAVLIACLGLFGLSSFTIVQRTKEIGIRKVLGASVSQIVRLLSRDFLRVIMVAGLVASPVAYFVAEEWLSHYAVRISLNGWIFILPVVIILLIAVVTVSFQTIRTALGNPVNSLRQE